MFPLTLPRTTTAFADSLRLAVDDEILALDDDAMSEASSARARGVFTGLCRLLNEPMPTEADRS